VREAIPFELVLIGANLEDLGRYGLVQPAFGLSLNHAIHREERRGRGHSSDAHHRDKEAVVEPHRHLYLSLAFDSDHTYQWTAAV
jgi:hypothetical protein